MDKSVYKTKQKRKSRSQLIAIFQETNQKEEESISIQPSFKNLKKKKSKKSKINYLEIIEK